MTQTAPSPPFSRLLLKLSGETLQGDTPFGIDPNALSDLSSSLKQLLQDGHEIAIVLGGGNIFRGTQLLSKGIPQTPADQMGMLATLMNGLALQAALEADGVPSHILSALRCPQIAETYSWRRAKELLKQKRLIIFVGGTGNPYFTTDTAAALRALEIDADCLLKATQVDGIYDNDPKSHPDAKRFDTITYKEILFRNLGVMDASAVALCQRKRLPILVFNKKLLHQKHLVTHLLHKHLGTLVQGE